MKGLTVNFLNPSSFEGHDNQHRPDDPEILVDFKGVALESLPVISPLPIFFTTFPFFETNLEHWSHGMPVIGSFCASIENARFREVRFPSCHHDKELLSSDISQSFFVA